MIIMLSDFKREKDWMYSTYMLEYQVYNERLNKGV